MKLPAWLPRLIFRLTKATSPLRLPTKHPPCFASQSDWEIYRKLANYSAGDGFKYCTDCTPEYQREMRKQGRCSYPLTQFVKTPSGMLVGRRRK